MQLTLVGMSSYIGTHTAGLIKMQPIGALFSKTVYVRDFDFQGATSLACPQDSRAALPRFARPGRD